LLFFYHDNNIKPLSFDQYCSHAVEKTCKAIKTDKDENYISYFGQIEEIVEEKGD